MYRITNIELDNLKNNRTSLSQSFCTAFIGAFVGFLVPLMTVALSMDMAAAFKALTVAFGILAVFFGIKWCQDSRDTSKCIEQIKKRDH